jgi:hypothetical protein
VILAQHPHHKPEMMKKSPKPMIHAASHATRWWFYEAYSWFVATFRTAARNCGRETGWLSSG